LGKPDGEFFNFLPYILMLEAFSRGFGSCKRRAKYRGSYTQFTCSMIQYAWLQSRFISFLLTILNLNCLKGKNKENVKKNICKVFGQNYVKQYLYVLF